MSEIKLSALAKLKGHLSTILASQFRKIDFHYDQRLRIETADTDFIDIDIKQSEQFRQHCILCHGLEGDSQRPYMKGMAKYLFENQINVYAVNLRSCSGEINRSKCFYHSAKYDDIVALINHFPQITQFSLVGFSLGANLMLNTAIHGGLGNKIRSVVAISVPLHLSTASKAMNRFENTFYYRRFIRKLEKKLQIKSQYYPDLYRKSDFAKIKSFVQFDNQYTAPLHGFHDAEDYYQKASPLFRLNQLRQPCLIINALNDPLLTRESFPETKRMQNTYIQTFYPNYGGHVGFELSFPNLVERKTVDFLKAQND